MADASAAFCRIIDSITAVQIVTALSQHNHLMSLRNCTTV